MSIASVFSNIYQSSHWGPETSGSGSVMAQTVSYRSFLREVIRTYNIKTVIDVGCGLCEHIPDVWDNLVYLGIDPVQSVIQKNRLRYPHRAFHCGLLDDITILRTFDLAIVKDVFQHLPNSEVAAMLLKLKAVPWLLITNDVAEANVDCEVGGWRPINLEGPPFNLVATEKLTFQSCPFVKASVLVSTRSCS